MSLKKTIPTLWLVVAMSSLASAQVKFERKLPEGTTRKVETMTKIDQKMTIAGMDIDTDSSERSAMQITTGKRDASGNVRVQEKTESLMVSTKIQGTEYEFDSANPENTGASAFEFLRPVHKALAKRVTTTVYDKDNKITQIEFDQDPLNGLDEMARNLVKDQLDPEKIKNAANQDLQMFPTEAVNKGDSWERTAKRNLGAGQVMTVATRYTYEGETEKNGKKYDKIVSKVLSVDLTVEETAAPMFSIKSSDLKPSDSKGELLYDRKLGEVVYTTSMVQITGDLVLVINGMDLDTKLELKMETSTQPRQ
ncbi:MAG TPA: DUF6263 family protein [Planctomycetaceae bacterium]|nr:DUF6263 family protein [Planctomycetaceae bacterium]